jgi:hypothetical protein
MLSVTNWHNDVTINGYFNTISTGGTIDLSGVNQLNGTTYVNADTGNIEFTMTSTASISGDSYALTNNSLYLHADTGHKIIFSINHDLQFSGVNVAPNDFLITYSGLGSLEFNIAGGKTLTFSPLVAGLGGSMLMVIEDHAVGIPSVVFQRLLGSEAYGSNVNVVIGARSLISFLSKDIYNPALTNNYGLILFDTTTPIGSQGRYILKIQDNGSFIISGHLLDEANYTEPLIADIDFEEPAGNLAQVEVYNDGNASDWASLVVENYNGTWSKLWSDPFCEGGASVYSEIRKGFVLGSFGKIITDDAAYLDYIAVHKNVTLTPVVPAATLNGRLVEQVIKQRNPAAFIADGAYEADPDIPSDPQIQCEGISAVYFRSGVDKFGTSQDTVLIGTNTVFGFVVDPTEDVGGTGSIAFDVEAPLSAFKPSIMFLNGTSIFEILSDYVQPYGGPTIITGTTTQFQKRTFAKDADGNYYRYGTACWLINDALDFESMNLKHTDENHVIYEKNSLASSAPAYIGGEKRQLLCKQQLGIPLNNNINLFNSNLLLHTSAALTGVDIQVPNIADFDNESSLVAYYNGYYVDHGNGRQLILGTDLGSTAADQATIINRDAHFNVQQLTEQNIAGSLQDMYLDVAPNNNQVIDPAIYTYTAHPSIATQYSVHDIFLGNRSNISIGEQSYSFTPSTHTDPTLIINGDFYSFDTQGGLDGHPELSVGSGEGAMFVDKYGTVEINPENADRVIMGMMAVYSGTGATQGVIDLPKSQVLFGNQVGIARWDLNLTDANQRVIIGVGQYLSDYTLDWKHTTRDYANFIPFEPATVPAAGAVGAVIEANITNIPEVLGVVDQLQIAQSRLGDQAHLKIGSGGFVRELVLLTHEDVAQDLSPATAPVAVIDLESGADLGLGSAGRNPDSQFASVVLGLNGITIIANGTSHITLNDNVIINNVCHILAGPDFVATSTIGPNILTIDSTVPRELRIKSDGVLDLTSFTNFNQQVHIGGNVKLILEPGAQILMNGGAFVVRGDAQIYCEPDVVLNRAAGTDVTSTDLLRVKWIGIGYVTIKENGSMLIPRGAFVGIEGNADFPLTNQSWLLSDAGRILLGSDKSEGAVLYGGALQVGNTSDIEEGSVAFALTMDSQESLLDINTQGFLGFDVGIVNKPGNALSSSTGAPDNWLVGNLYNVDGIILNLNNGTLRNAQIYPGDNQLAGLLAFGPTEYVLNTDFQYLTMLGGGNMALINSASVAPVVDSADGFINEHLSVGLMCSTPALSGDLSKLNNVPANPMTGAELFGYLKQIDYATENFKTGSVISSLIGANIVGFISNGTDINRIPITSVYGATGLTDMQPSLNIGSVQLAIAGPVVGDGIVAYEIVA